MKLDPGFINHWKTERLIEQLGPEGLVVILRIWGQAQIRREWRGLQITAKRLAMETKWKGDANHLLSVLTDPDAPWLDAKDDGTFAIHGFEEHQRQVIHLWSAGGKGGRPKKSESPPLKNKKDSSSSSYTSSSSYPIGLPNENHMVFDPLKQALPFESESFKTAWASWVTHRKEIKKKLTETSVSQQFKRFAEWGEGKSIAAIEHTVEKGWQGLVEAPQANGKPAGGRHAGTTSLNFTGDEF